MVGQDARKNRHTVLRGAGRKQTPGTPRMWVDRHRRPPYEELNHPADLLLEIRGEDLEQLLDNALYALYANVVDLQGLRGERWVTIQATGEDAARLLGRLLNEALFLLDTEGFLGTAAKLQVHEDEEAGISAQAQIWGLTLDQTRHDLLSEIKAATQHSLEIRREEDGSLVGTVLLDT